MGYVIATVAVLIFLLVIALASSLIPQLVQLILNGVPGL